MSQLLCEQVVGRGLRRASYELNDDGKFTEEIAHILGVPFEVIPFKATSRGPSAPRVKRHHVHAIPEKAQFEIRFPRVEGYTQAIRNKVVVDWKKVPVLVLTPDSIPPEYEAKGLSMNNVGRLSLNGPNKITKVSLDEYRAKKRFQELVFDIASGLTKHYVGQPQCQAPAHVLFPQIMRIVDQYLKNHIEVRRPADIKDVGLSPYYGWLIEVLTENIRPDTAQGETPEIPLYETGRAAGSTEEVDFWTSRDPRQVMHSHVNYVVPDTASWEQQAAYFIDSHPLVDAFVKNAGLGFAIPYLYNDQMHDYMPDFIIRVKANPTLNLILETKGYDPRAEIKQAAAQRWVAAVNAEGSYGRWAYVMTRKTSEVPSLIASAVNEAEAAPTA
jgi:type III restriction enzyme